LNFDPEPGADGVIPRWHRYPFYYQPQRRKPEPMNQPKPTYDYSRCKRETLEKLAAANGGLDWQAAQVACNEEARVKTLAEYDAEIGALLREKLSGNWGVGQTAFDALRKLVEESRGAK
jgi:hypothetical protein